MSQVRSAQVGGAQLERAPRGTEEWDGAIALPTRTDDGEFLVGGDGSGPVLGVIRREKGRFYCYPCTPEFPRLGPFERLEHAAKVVTETASRLAARYLPA